MKVLIRSFEEHSLSSLCNLRDSMLNTTKKERQAMSYLDDGCISFDPEDIAEGKNYISSYFDDTEYNFIPAGLSYVEDLNRHQIKKLLLRQLNICIFNVHTGNEY